MPDEILKCFAIDEVSRIGLLDAEVVSEAYVERVPRAYPAYFGGYDRFDEARIYLDRLENSFLIGRNGMHRYNKQDCSMLTAKAVVGGLAKTPWTGACSGT